MKNTGQSTHRGAIEKRGSAAISNSSKGQEHKRSTKIKQQSATEFLVTYGWAILVIAIIMLAVFATGIFNSNNYASQQCVISSGFSCLSLFAGSDGTILVNIQQATKSPINITAIGCNQNSMVTGINMLTFNTIKSQIFLPIGGNFTTVLQCYNNQGTAYSGATGSVFSGHIVINYTNDLTHIPAIAVGSVSAKLSSPSLLYACTSTITSVSTTSTSVSSTTTAIGSLTSTSTSTTTSSTTSTTMAQYIYCIGSNIIPYQQVYYAPISSTGVGAWSYSAEVSPIDVNDAGCATYNNYIYCVGTSYTLPYNQAYYAPISGTGVGAWTQTTSYPVSIYNAGCSTYNGYIYCVGSQGTATGQETYYAPISSTGIGAWTAGPNYPISMIDSGCSINSGTIYCVGSTASAAAEKTAYYAPVSATGFGAWTSTNGDPAGAGGIGCSISNNYIYCVGSNTGSFTNVYYAPVSSTGIGAWSSAAAAPYPFAVADTGCAITGGYIYCVGTQGTSPYNQVYYAPVSTPGVGAWTSTTNYPISMQDAYCVVQGYSGGFMGGGGTNTGSASTSTTTVPQDIYCTGTLGTATGRETYYAPISSTGIGAWTAGPNYPVSKYYDSCAIASNNYIYCVGAATGAGTESYYAPVSATGFGTWTPMILYPFGFQEAGCSAYNGYIYCVGSYYTGQGTELAYYSPISTTGTGVSAWTTTKAFPDLMCGSGCSISNGYIYCLGADYGFYSAPISAAGIGAWSGGWSYPISSTCNSGCSVSGNYMYCVGSDTSPYTQDYYAPLSTAGVMGAWTSTTSYPVGFSDAGCSISNRYIYCVGTGQVSPYKLAYYAPISTPGIGAWTATTGYPVGLEDGYCQTPGTGGGYAGGGGPNTGPTNGPYFVNVVVTDAYASSTPSPFQEMLTINSLAYQPYINSNWNNVEFTTGPGATGNVVQAWVEANPSNAATNTLVWINVPGGVPANGNTIVYMNFMLSNVMSASGPTGEAPQLSNPSYGLYDNGALAFPTFYDNFAGKSINAAWNVNGAAGLYSVNNGLSLLPSSVTGCAFTLTSTYTGPLAVDAYQSAAPAANIVFIGSIFSDWQTSTGGCPIVSGAYQEIYDSGIAVNSISQNLGYPGDGGVDASNPATVNTNIPQVTSLAVSTTNAIAYQNYNNMLSQAATYNILSGNTYPGIIADGASSVTVSATWFRIRAFPPGNVMPIASYGR